MLKNKLSVLRVIGFAEAASWLLLLLIAMPLKYIWMKPLAVKIVGWIHGILFITYIVLALLVAKEHKWKFSKLINAFISAFVPLGTYFFDSRLKKEQLEFNKP
ncbi:MAG TPA: DUF3817 domain-containing protein [Chitinophagaceae bacterium]|nr:DUF3817 domain-containing protein [Chitinophagaceae bacterium]